MPFNTSALVNILLSDTPSLEAFEAHLNKATTPHFDDLDEVENERLHQALGVKTPASPIDLFLTALFTIMTQNTRSAIPGAMVIATLKKFHELHEPDLLIHLSNVIHLLETPPAPHITLRSLPTHTTTSPHMTDLRLTLFALMKTLRVTQTQINNVSAFDAQNSHWASTFNAFLTNTNFSWRDDDSALVALLPNDEGLWTPIGFFHGLYLHQTTQNKTDQPLINRDITLLALEKNLPHPVPYIPLTLKNIHRLYHFIIFAAFFSKKITHVHLRTLATALRPHNLSFEFSFNRGLAISTTNFPLVTDIEKPRVLVEAFGWNPNQAYVSKKGGEAESFMTRLKNPVTLAHLSVMLTLPQITIDEAFATYCMDIAQHELNYHGKADKTQPIKIIEHLIQNPGLNGTEVKEKIIEHAVAMLFACLRLSYTTIKNDYPAPSFCSTLLNLKNDDESLERLIHVINTRRHVQESQAIFDSIINHPRLTQSQREKLDADTREARSRKNNKLLLVWPEPITPELLEQPSVKQLSLWVEHQINQGVFIMPSDSENTPAYSQLPLAILNTKEPEEGFFKNETILPKNKILAVPLILFLLRNHGLRPTQYGLHPPERGSTALLANILIFILLGHSDSVFTLAADKDHCLDSYVDAIIRLAINTNIASSCAKESIRYLVSSHLSEYRNYALVTEALQHTSLKKEIKSLSSDDIKIALQATVRKYVQRSPAICTALRESMLLGTPCLMNVIAAEDKVTMQTLRTMPISPTTIDTLKDNIAGEDAFDYRSALLVIALIGGTLPADEFDAIIRQHLLYKTLDDTGQEPDLRILLHLPDAEKETLIGALELLDSTTLTTLQRMLVAWCTENNDRARTTQQLIDNHSSETNPLLLTLMLDPSDYKIKKTTFYKQLQARLNTYKKTAGTSQQELRVMPPVYRGTSRKTPPEAAISNENIQQRSKQFIQDNIRGKITWSNTAPFLPLPGQAHLPLSLFSLAEMRSYELWECMFKAKNLSRQFLLFLFRREDMPLFNERELFRYARVFTLLGKDETVLNLEADENHRLMPYQAAVTRILTHLELEAFSFYNKEKSIHYEKVSFISPTIYHDIGFDDIALLYNTYINHPGPIGNAVRQCQLLDKPCLLLLVEEVNPTEENKTINQTRKKLRSLDATPETLEKIRLILTDPWSQEEPDFFVKYLIRYLAFAPSIEPIEAQIATACFWSLSKVKKSALAALKELEPKHIAHLKYQLNVFFAKHKRDYIGVLLKASLDNHSNPLALWLLQIGQKSLEVKNGGNYYRRLNLFYHDSPIKEEEAIKYGLAPKPGPQ